jgi:hypothetical protein
MSIMICFTKLHLSNSNSSSVDSIKQNMDFNFQLPSTFVFLVFHKNGLIKSCWSFEDLLAYKVSWSQVEGHKFFVHLRSLNVCHFGMVKGMGLKSMGEFHEIS